MYCADMQIQTFGLNKTNERLSNHIEVFVTMWLLKTFNLNTH